MTTTTKPKAKRKAASAAPALSATKRRRLAQLEAKVEESKGYPGYPMVRALVKLAALGPFNFKKMP